MRSPGTWKSRKLENSRKVSLKISLLKVSLLLHQAYTIKKSSSAMQIELVFQYTNIQPYFCIVIVIKFIQPSCPFSNAFVN